MMTREDRQEALSLAYVKAVAAVAGMTCSIPLKDYGIDVSVNEVERHGPYLFESGIQLDVQVKSATAVAVTRTSIGYDLLVRAYDNLRLATDVRRILTVLVLPRDEAEWVRQTPKKLELRGCVYWASLPGRPAVKNRSSIRISIPRRQVFTPDSLRWIMNRIRAREELS